MFSYFRRFDWFLFGSAVLLNLVGLAVLYSTSLASAPGSAADLDIFWKQLAFSGFGIVVCLALAATNYRVLGVLARPLYLLGLALLVLVALFGSTQRGATGWFRLGPLSLQPVEVVKLLLIVFLAKFFSASARDLSGWRRIIGSGFSFALVFGLVMAQPDLGSGLLLFVTWLVMLLVSGVKRKQLVLLGALCLIAAVSAWVFVLKPYQKDRLSVFINPATDPQGAGYNIRQSLIAVGSGGFLGKGLGFGSQSQLRFLPERQTDFIFSVIAEELGMVGVLALVALFGILLWRIWLRARRAKDDFTIFLMVGIMAAVIAEVTVNVGGALSLLPLTGVTLPFISYGGSSLVMKYAMLGVVEAVAARE